MMKQADLSVVDLELTEGITLILANLPHASYRQWPDDTPGFAEELLAGLQKIAFAACYVHEIEQERTSGLREVAA